MKNDPEAVFEHDQLVLHSCMEQTDRLLCNDHWAVEPHQNIGRPENILLFCLYIPLHPSQPADKPSEFKSGFYAHVQNKAVDIVKFVLCLSEGSVVAQITFLLYDDQFLPA